MISLAVSGCKRDFLDQTPEAPLLQNAVADLRVDSQLAFEISMTAHGQYEIANKPDIPSESYILKTNKLLLALPKREVNLDNLTQNPK